jgi:hypothetical protein
MTDTTSSGRFSIEVRLAEPRRCEESSLYTELREFAKGTSHESTSSFFYSGQTGAPYPI